MQVEIKATRGEESGRERIFVECTISGTCKIGFSPEHLEFDGLNGVCAWFTEQLKYEIAEAIQNSGPAALKSQLKR